MKIIHQIEILCISIISGIRRMKNAICEAIDTFIYACIVAGSASRA